MGFFLFIFSWGREVFCWGEMQISRPCCYQQPHGAVATELVSLRNLQCSRNLTYVMKRNTAKSQKASQEPGAQQDIHVCAFETPNVHWAEWQTYSRPVFNFFLLFSSSEFPFLAKLSLRACPAWAAECIQLLVAFPACIPTHVTTAAGTAKH